MLHEYTVPRQIMAIVPARAMAQRFCVMASSTPSAPDAHHREQLHQTLRRVLHVVSRRLPGERGADARLDRLVRLAGAQQRSQLHLPVTTEAGLERPARGHARAVAPVAEVVGHSADEADVAFPPARIAAPHVVRRPPATLVVA